jgi:predicted transcriptional regulator
MSQINAFTIFDELIESRTEDIKANFDLVHQCVRILKLVLGIESSDFNFFGRLLTSPNPF